LFTLFLMYPGVSSTVLSLFVCKDIDSKSYLVSDFTIYCYDDRWWKFFPLVLIMVFVYPVGVPSFFLFVLYRARHTLHWPTTKMQLGFLYDAYNLEAWWFELADMIHKLTMTSLLKFFPVDIQMPSGMVAVVIYLWVILMAQPYLRRDDDRLHQFVQVELFLLVCAGYVLYYTQDTGLDRSTDILLSIILIFITIFLLIAFVYMAGHNIIKILRDRRKKMSRHKRRSKSKMSAEDNVIRLTLNRPYKRSGRTKKQLSELRMRGAE